MKTYTYTMGFSGGDEVDGIMEISITENGYKFIKKAKSEMAKSEIINSADVINAVSIELYSGCIGDYNTPDELLKVKELKDWEEITYAKLVDFEAILKHNSFYITAKHKYGSSEICSYNAITTEELDDFFIEPSKEAEAIEMLYGVDSEIIRTCEKYVLSRRNIHRVNEFLVHKIIRDEENVLLEQIACEDKLEKAEIVFLDSCDAEVLEIRFLRQGFIKAQKPDGFDAMNNEQKEEWANEVLESKSDFELVQAMADFSDADVHGDFFDEVPKVAAIETRYGEDTVFRTAEWDAFAYPPVVEHFKLDDGHRYILQDLLAEDAQVKILNDLAKGDRSYLFAILIGEGAVQFGNMTDKQLFGEFMECSSSIALLDEMSEEKVQTIINDITGE